MVRPRDRSTLIGDVLTSGPRPECSRVGAPQLTDPQGFSNITSIRFRSRTAFSSTSLSGSTG